ncbi:hypothetical protein KCU95_g2308, partial [Aureobasidium melanogenum]
MSLADVFTMSRMSPEALERMLWAVSIADVNELLRNAPPGPAGDNLRTACQSRRSTTRYLENNFGSGTELLEAMSRHKAYLSGSRSLDFFVPGRLDPTSDWDFYLPRDVHVVCSFMEALTHMGVSWEGPLQKLEAAMSNGGGEVMFATLQYSHHYNHGDFQNLASSHGIDVSGLMEVPFQLPGPTSTGTSEYTWPWITVVVANQALQTEYWKPEDVEHDEGHAEMYQRIGSVINGHLARSLGGAKVQLILEDRNREFDCPALMRFHSSCVQSVIGPHIACHFYGQLTTQFMSYGWRSDLRSEHAQEKYRRRGFVYVARDRSFVRLRMGDDEESIVVLRESPTNAPQSIVEMYQESVKKMSWQELSRDVVALPSVVKWYMGDYRLSNDEWFVRGCRADVFMALIQQGVLPCLT